MYRISHRDDGHPQAVGVCHDCKVEAYSHIWGAISDSYQTVPPSGWTTFLDGRMQRLRCAPCQTDRDDRYMTTRELIERAREWIANIVLTVGHAERRELLAALDAHLSEPACWNSLSAKEVREAVPVEQSAQVPDDGNLNGKHGPLVERGWDGGINERTEFEAAMILKGALPITATAGFFDGIGEFWFERDEKGRYKFSRMQDVWEGWQARAKVAAPSAQPKETP